MKKVLFPILALVLALGLALPMAGTAAAATPIYVDGVSGNDGNNGETPGKAVKTIKKGIELVDDGGTVDVAAATYNEHIINQFAPYNKSFNLIGAGADLVTWTAPTGQYPLQIDQQSGVSYEVSGFKFIGDGKHCIKTAGGGFTDLDIHDNVFENAALDPTHCGTGNALWGLFMCRSSASRDVSGVSSIRVHDNVFNTEGGICMSNTKSFDIYDNEFSVLCEGIYSAAGCCCAGWTIGDHHIYGNTFSGISGDAIKLDYWNGGFTYLVSTIEWNNFEGTGGYAVYVTTYRVTENAENNWWGDASGPDDPVGTNEVPPCTAEPTTEINADGAGDQVSDNVDYCPWLTGLAYTGGPQPTTSVVLEATLSNSADGAAGAEVEFYVDGALVGSAITDASGVATLPIGTKDVGVYTVRAVALAPCLEAEALVAVYDPTAGFVTGGGWIDSQPGAYMPEFSVVTEANLGVDWFINDTRWDGYVAFVEGPGNPPLGSGSLEMGTTASQDKAQLFNYDHIDTLLADIGGITYATYRNSSSTNPPAQYPAINIEVDYIGDGSSYTTLVWEPIYAYGQSNLAVDTWQTWDTMAPSQTGFGGGWWSTKNIPGVCAFNCFVDWETIVQNNPNAKIKYGFGVNVGSGWDGVFTGAIDALTLTINDETTAYDFEQMAPPTGKASFGFVSKYKKGASVPEGNTEFVFRAADLNFHSSSYDWLVVTGSDYARFKGTGTINGAGDYKFMLWAGDGVPDTFRIKIWEEDGSGNETVIYDNGMDQAIGGGSIVVHKK